MVGTQLDSAKPCLNRHDKGEAVLMHVYTAVPCERGMHAEDQCLACPPSPKE